MKWLITAILATLFFGFYGLFDKLSTFQEPVVSNFIIYFTTVIIGLALLVIRRKKINFSKEAYFSGIFAGVSGLILIYSLVSNFVIIIFPFVSFASVVFFFLILVLEKPKLSSLQKLLVAIGIMISTIGAFISSTSTIGGFFSFLNNFKINLNFLFIGLVISIGFGIWSYFSFVVIKKKNVEILNANFWILLGSFTTAIVALFFIDVSNSLILDSRIIFPIMAGLSIIGGSILTLKAYKITTGKSKIQETIIAILTNAEIIPLIFLSYFILREFTVEGFIGAFTVFIGLSILNYAERM